MPRSQLVYDGLWRCLCPKVDKNVLPRALNASCRPQISSRQRPRNANMIQRGRFVSTALENTTSSDEAQPLNSPNNQTEAGKQATPRQLNPALQRIFTNFSNVSTPDIIDALRTLKAPFENGPTIRVENRHGRIVSLVKYLVKHRDYPLDSFIYECMMAAMADPMGSSLGVRKLLEDMLAHKVSYTAELCYKALEALTVHPDYTTRQDIIDIMNRYWFEFTVPAKQNIALAMLREGQYELALDKFTELIESKDRVDLWVYDIFIVEYGRMGFLDEMLQILKKRKHAQGTDAAFRSIMLMALDFFSQAFHLKGTVFVWANVVQNSVHNPSTGILENVLATGAKHGDTSLATKALDMLSKRSNGRLLYQHHEAIIEAFTNAGDIVSAFSTLKMVENSGWVVMKGNTRPIYRHLLKNPELIDTAVSTIATMQKEGPLPLQLVTVTIEAMAQVQNAEAAMPLYRDIYFLTGYHPSYHLIKHLLERSAEVETKYALAKDFDALVLKGPEKSIEALSAFEIMIPACAEKGDFDLAFSLAESIMGLPERLEARRKLTNGLSRYKPWQTHEWVEPLIDHALKAKDSRVWWFVDELDQGDDAPARMIRELLQRHPIERPAKQADATAGQVGSK